MRRPLFAATLRATLAIAAATLLGLLALQGRGLAEDPPKPAAGKPAKKATRSVVVIPPFSGIPRPEQLKGPDPATVYRVEPIPVRGIVQPRTALEQKALEAASALVARLRPIPEDRIRYFGWLNEPDSPAVFRGWAMFVQQATPTPDGGQLITLRVSALATTRNMGHLVNNFIEEYLWSNGRLQYLRGYSCPIIGEKPIFTRL